MSNWRDTVMSDEQLEENTRKDYKDFAVRDETGYIQDILVWTREAQAEITWNKAIREVVEWLGQYRIGRHKLFPRLFEIFDDDWNAKLKEWGIDE